MMPIFFRQLFPGKFADMSSETPPSRKGRSKAPHSTWKGKLLKSSARRTVLDRRAYGDDPSLLRNVYIELQEPPHVATSFTNGGNAAEVSSGHPTRLPSSPNDGIIVSKTVDVESQTRGHKHGMSPLEPAHMGHQTREDPPSIVRHVS